MRFLKAALVAMVDAGLVVDMASGRVGPAGMGGGGNGEQSDKCCGDVFHGDLLVESLFSMMCNEPLVRNWCSPLWLAGLVRRVR